MPPAPPVIKIVLLVSFIIKYLLSYVTIYKSHSTSTRRLRTLMGGLRINAGKLNRLCRRGRFAPPESRVCRPVPLSSLRPELRRERTNPYELRILLGS